MALTVIPFTFDSTQELRLPHIENTEEKGGSKKPRITYWGIYLDGKQVSYTSSKELAERTKVWMEKWLSDEN